LEENIYIAFNLPEKCISALGYTICPFNGRNTKGIFCIDDPVTNGAKGHSVT
jgi:hypothetical protein